MYQKGVSGNPKGRPKMSDEEREEREAFKKLLRTATVPALRAIVEISQSKGSKDRFNACRFIIEKCYGNNAVFFSSGSAEDIEPVVIRVMPYRSEDSDEDWEESLDGEDWEEE